MTHEDPLSGRCFALMKKRYEDVELEEDFRHPILSTETRDVRKLADKETFQCVLSVLDRDVLAAASFL